MAEPDILNLMDQKKDLSEEVAQKVMENPPLLSVPLDGMSSSTARVRFRSAKILKIISLKNPKILYSQFKFFVELMESENTIIKWNALDVLANLTGVDEEHQFDAIFNRYYGFLEDPSMITAAHVVDNSPRIVANRPDLQHKITANLLKIKQTSRDAECGNILGEKVILAFDKYFEEIQDKDAVISFAESLLKSQRNATKTKAEKFLKKHGKKINKNNQE